MRAGHERAQAATFALQIGRWRRVSWCGGAARRARAPRGCHRGKQRLRVLGPCFAVDRPLGGMAFVHRPRLGRERQAHIVGFRLSIRRRSSAKASSKVFWEQSEPGAVPRLNRRRHERLLSTVATPHTAQARWPPAFSTSKAEADANQLSKLWSLLQRKRSGSWPNRCRNSRARIAGLGRQPQWPTGHRERRARTVAEQSDGGGKRHGTLWVSGSDGCSGIGGRGRRGDAGGFTSGSIDGGQIALDDWAGQPILVVKTASMCGFAPQFTAMQALYDRYRAAGLVVLACRQTISSRNWQATPR